MVMFCIHNFILRLKYNIKKKQYQSSKKLHLKRSLTFDIYAYGQKKNRNLNVFLNFPFINTFEFKPIKKPRSTDRGFFD